MSKISVEITKFSENKYEVAFTNVSNDKVYIFSKILPDSDQLQMDILESSPADSISWTGILAKFRSNFPEDYSVLESGEKIVENFDPHLTYSFTGDVNKIRISTQLLQPHLDELEVAISNWISLT